MNLGSQGVDIKDVVSTPDIERPRPSINEIESSINNFPNILPQGTTSARPIGPELPPAQQLTPVNSFPSLSNLPTTTPPSSSFINDPPGFVPGTNIGNHFLHLLNFYTPLKILKRLEKNKNFIYSNSIIRMR